MWKTQTMDKFLLLRCSLFPRRAPCPNTLEGLKPDASSQHIAGESLSLGILATLQLE